MSDIRIPLSEESEKDLSPSPSPCAPPPARSAGSEGSADGLPPRLAFLVWGIEPPGVREFVRGLFTDILKLLVNVESVRGAVENSGSLDGLPRVFEALRKLSGYLLTNVETAELRVEGLPDELTDNLAASSFALRHELRRVFEKELNAEAGDRPEPRHGPLRACALLENCFQQLTVTIARTFDASVSGVMLFENYRRRREESLTLRAELRALLGDARRVEKHYTALSSRELLHRARRFRYECLHHLMYRDWEDFERFADALELCYESEGEMRVLLHKMICYLEALLNQVGMRAVLTDE
jgi:hypothetical protein